VRDRLSFTVANDSAGKFQTFARKHWGVQLPSTLVDDSQGLTYGLLLALQNTGTGTVQSNVQGLLLALHGVGSSAAVPISETIPESLVA
jgi:hypothetical protein